MSNPHIVRAGEFELDERMSAETKKFVSESLAVLRPSLFAQLPIELIRHGKDKEEKEIAAGVQFANLPSPRQIHIRNPTDGYEIPAWVFKPSDAAKNAPIVVFFHGGGWSTGSTQSTYQFVATLAAHSRMIWISVEYRLAPENKYRTQVTDYRAAIEWVDKNRAEFSSPDAKLGVLGESAGGQIAALMGHYYKSILDFQVLVYPSLDLATEYNSSKEFAHECYLLTPEVINFCVTNYLEDPSMAKLPDVSPIFMSDFSSLPPCLIVAAEFDSLIDSNKAYYEKIVNAKSRAEYHVVKSTIHGWVPNGTKLVEAFNECVDRIVEFLKKF